MHSFDDLKLNCDVLDLQHRMLHRLTEELRNAVELGRGDQFLDRIL